MKWFKIKKNNILKLIIFIIMLILFIYLGTRNYNVTILDNERFALEYKDISKNNCFIYKHSEEILDIIKNKSGIIFMGFSNNIWSHYYAEYLNEMASVNDVSEIYYYDFYKDRKINNKTYLKIVDTLQDYLIMNDVKESDITAPMVVIVKDSKIIYVNNDIAFLKGNKNPTDYFNDYERNILKAEFNVAIKEYLEEGK